MLICSERCLLPSCNACIQSLPLISFVLNSFIHYCIGDNLWYADYGFSARLKGKCSASKGTYTILYLEHYQEHIRAKGLSVYMLLILPNVFEVAVNKA